jgi:hypothetical protein
MFEPAKLQMNCASARGIRILCREPDGRPTLTASVTSPYLWIAGSTNSFRPFLCMREPLHETEDYL